MRLSPFSLRYQCKTLLCNVGFCLNITAFWLQRDFFGVASILEAYAKESGGNAMFWLNFCLSQQHSEDYQHFSLKHSSHIKFKKKKNCGTFWQAFLRLNLFRKKLVLPLYTLLHTVPRFSCNVPQQSARAFRLSGYRESTYQVYNLSGKVPRAWTNFTKSQRKEKREALIAQRPQICDVVVCFTKRGTRPYRDMNIKQRQHICALRTPGKARKCHLRTQETLRGRHGESRPSYIYI